MTMQVCRHGATHAARWCAVLAAAIALMFALTMAGCGGSEGEGGVGVGGTGSYASGPITGFGSVIVNGIEFDDSPAQVEDEDGVPSSRSLLRLGMLTEIEGGPISGAPTAPVATASRIRFSSELAGPVESIDAAGRTLVVFGQGVRVALTTVFDDRLAAGLASIAVGDVVVVYGFFDPRANGFVATRIEPRPSGLPAFRVRGPVHDLDSVARSFAIGARSFSYAGLAASAVPAALANGAFVRVLSSSAPPPNGRWTVLGFGPATTVRPIDQDNARLRGLVTAFTSNTAFFVNGQPVDASGASFPDGTAGLAPGARVEVEGSLRGGVLRAMKVEIDSDDGASFDFQLKGSIESQRPLLQTFVLRGVTVYYGAAIPFDKGAPADIAVGAAAEVRGVLSADGTRLLATRVRIGK